MTTVESILFSQAQVRLEEILELAAEFNSIAEHLTALGYRGPKPDYPGMEAAPFPQLDISRTGDQGGDELVRDAEFIMEYYQRGRIARSSKSQPIKRVSLLNERIRLGQEFGWQCFYCGGAGDEDSGPDGRGWHVDHVYPVIRGGDDQQDNHVLACATCNLQKRARSAAEFFREKAKA